MERKSITLELKDFSASSRTAVISHAVYDNIDRTGDISRKGMFNKSWKENKSIDFLFNHDYEKVPGSVQRVWEDETKAYTEVKFGKWTLGDDVLEMADSGVLKGASFGYIAQKKSFINVKGKKVRELKEVIHLETSLLTLPPANPLTEIVSLTKSFNEIEIKYLSNKEQDVLKNIVASDHKTIEDLVLLSSSLDANSDLYTWIMWNIVRRAEMISDIRGQLKWNVEQSNGIKSYLDSVDKFIKNSKASDDIIKGILNEYEEVKSLVEILDTVSTHGASEQLTSEEKGVSNEILLALKLINAKI